MSMNFFRCRFCGITQSEIYITDEKMRQLLSCCPGCSADHFAEGYAIEQPEQVEHDFCEGDAVIAYDGDVEYRGVVQSVYDDVVEVEYLDEFGMDVMEFHVDDVMET